MRKLSDKYVVDSVRDILQEAPEDSEISGSQPDPSPVQLLRFGKRRHFALGLILLAIFLLLLSLLLPKEDLYLWAGYSGILMLVGAWQWDKAKKDIVVSAPSKTTPACDEPNLKLHSIDGDAL